MSRMRWNIYCRYLYYMASFEDDELAIILQLETLKLDKDSKFGKYTEDNDVLIALELYQKDLENQTQS